MGPTSKLCIEIKESIRSNKTFISHISLITHVLQLLQVPGQFKSMSANTESCYKGKRSKYWSMVNIKGISNYMSNINIFLNVCRSILFKYVCLNVQLWHHMKLICINTAVKIYRIFRWCYAKGGGHPSREYPFFTGATKNFFGQLLTKLQPSNSDMSLNMMKGFVPLILIPSYKYLNQQQNNEIKEHDNYPFIYIYIYILISILN